MKKIVLSALFAVIFAAAAALAQDKTTFTITDTAGRQDYGRMV
jgi:signal recognition particle GTPase